MNICHVCGIPQDAGFFDDSHIKQAPRLGEEMTLARYELNRNYCGMLMYFAQFTEPSTIETPGYQWQIRCNGQPRDPYLAFQHIINPWGLDGFPIYLRLEESCLLELVIRNLSVSDTDSDNKLTKVGGRILGRYWYNTVYGDVSNRL